MTLDTCGAVIRNPVRAVRRGFLGAFPGALVAVSSTRHGNLEVVVVWDLAAERLGGSVPNRTVHAARLVALPETLEVRLVGVRIFTPGEYEQARRDARIWAAASRGYLRRSARYLERAPASEAGRCCRRATPATPKRDPKPRRFSRKSPEFAGIWFQLTLNGDVASRCFSSSLGSRILT